MSFRLARNPFQDVSYVYFLDKAKRFWTRYACQNDVMLILTIIEIILNQLSEVYNRIIIFHNYISTTHTK